MVEHKEFELKFNLNPASMPRLQQIPLIRGLKPRSRHPTTEVSVYFDTDKRKLHKKGLTLRVRRIDDLCADHQEDREYCAIRARRMGGRDRWPGTRSQPGQWHWARVAIGRQARPTAQAFIRDASAPDQLFVRRQLARHRIDH